jgi:hypothetical protein
MLNQPHQQNEPRNSNHHSQTGKDVLWVVESAAAALLEPNTGSACERRPIRTVLGLHSIDSSLQSTAELLSSYLLVVHFAAPEGRVRSDNPSPNYAQETVMLRHCDSVIGAI